MLVITDWLKNGIPIKDTKSPQPIDTMLEVKDLIAGIRKASLYEEDAATIVTILKERKLIDVNIEKKNVTNTDFIIRLENFWDYDKSPYIEDKRLHYLGLAKKALAATTINKIMLAGTVPLKWAKENEITTNSPFTGLMSFSGVKKQRGILEMDEAATWTSPDLMGGQFSHSVKHLCRNHHGIRRVPVKPIIIDLDIFEKLCSYSGSSAATVKAVQFTL